MRRIFMDLEMNPINSKYREERAVCFQEVIEFGAVCLDENNREIDSFQCYVRPEYNSGITSNIAKITGITTKHVENADTFEAAFINFITWCGQDYEIYSWSNSDPIQLRKEAELKDITVTAEFLYMFAHWHDLQKEYDEMFYCENQIGLRMAVENAGIEFNGREHSALADAMATADIFREMGEGRTLQMVHTMLDTAKKPLGTSLGDLLGAFALQPA